MQPDTRHSKRLKGAMDYKLCVFCEEDNAFRLHSYSTKNAGNNLLDMAMETGDDDILTKISSGDFVAIELKYHDTCLTRYINKHLILLRPQNPLEERTDVIKGQAFAEAVLGMEFMMEDGKYAFQLQNLHLSYQNRLHELGIDITVNKTRLKCKLLDYFGDFGLQEQSVGRSIVLTFPESIAKLLKEATADRNYEEEILVLRKATKICRCDEFAHSTPRFNGKCKSKEGCTRCCCATLQLPCSELCQCKYNK